MFGPNLFEKFQNEKDPEAQANLLAKIQENLKLGLRFGDAKTDFCINHAKNFRDYDLLSSRLVHLITVTARKAINA